MVVNRRRSHQRQYRFKNFREAFAFVERAAEREARAPRHHFGWGYATVCCGPKDQGLHENDFIMTKIDRIAASLPIMTIYQKRILTGYPCSTWRRLGTETSVRNAFGSVRSVVVLNDRLARSVRFTRNPRLRVSDIYQAMVPGGMAFLRCNPIITVSPWSAARSGRHRMPISTSPSSCHAEECCRHTKHHDVQIDFEGRRAGCQMRSVPRSDEHRLEICGNRQIGSSGARVP